MFKSGIKHNTIKRKTSEISNFLNFIIWNIVFFSLFPLASASIAPFVDENYESQEDLFDAILNTFFPIFFVILLNVSGKPGSIKNVILPLLDDILYNMITWMIPLIISFSYDDLMSIRIFSIINMCLHVICAVIAIIKWKRVAEVDYENLNLFAIVFLFMIFFPVIVIPIFWIITITHKLSINSIFVIFIILFGICLISLMSIIIVKVLSDRFERIMLYRIYYVLFITCFYSPNIFQTLLITLIWPINFYFVKACVFILVLSLTRNVSYFVDKVPDDFLATSTTMTQCTIRIFTKEDAQEIFKGTEISIEEMQTKITKIDEIQKTMQMNFDVMQKSMNEVKLFNALNQPKDEIAYT
ncbi:unnamed protein product [Rhizophagus irregularis]|nr:unnamed protein product [Rhizophagus irregularis]